MTIRLGVGRLRLKARLENPGTPQDDGEGGFEESWERLNPFEVPIVMELATAQNLERFGNNTVSSETSHIVSFHYHPQVTTKTRLTIGSRVFYATGVENPEGRNVTTVCFCTERVP